MEHPSASFHKASRFRAVLERHAIETILDADGIVPLLPEFRSLLGELEQSAKQNDYERFMSIDHALHRCMVGGAKVPGLLESWEHVFTLHTDEMWTILQSMWPRLIDLYQEHVHLIAAWETKDHYVALPATEEHIRAGWYRVRVLSGGEASNLGPAERVAAYLQIHYARKLEVPWLARHVAFLSSPQLNRLFQKQLNCSPNQYLKRIRLDRARKRLCLPGVQVGDVAKEVGYANPSHFIRDFNREYGMTPLKFLKSQPAECSTRGTS
ncbi:helix-turn-helix domain-containing protein [Blastopirellula sp. J2-11]|uniref:helix-turn-helix transcriptional regulator n=1 Tax=Blastopirellula sp. J2-11 TaxID=2943192 RepID=UPI0021CA46A6|nr:helix-turn-helix domain-containing protein [Blastopirellula sp. J2-11]UUO09223.1 helix-turn-helix domain-containing protein [Blastopirellula sp. J2-11]